MKGQFVSELVEGQLVTTLLLVREKEIRTSARSGKSWLELDLADRSGSIAAKMWDNFEAIAGTFERGDVVQFRARVKVYNGQKELALEQVISVRECEYEIADFLPHTKCDIEKMYADLRGVIAAMGDPWLRQLNASIVDDPGIAPKLKRAPAAMTMHHAFIGGLLEHTMSLIGLSRGVLAHYPELNAELVLTGIILHDIGKIDELRYERGIDYSTEGRLLGHIAMGVLLVREKVRAIPGFPKPLATLVEHLVLSHHGSYEFGSPALPQTREAVALHFLDDVDSKMAAMRATHDCTVGSGDWTDRNPALRRALLRADKFLATAENGSGEPAAENAFSLVPEYPSKDKK